MPEIRKIPIDCIVIRGDNPRREFDEEALRELAESIKRHGLLQPIIVRPKNGNYELVVGERRLKACKLIGLTEIDARVEAIDDSTSMELRLIENTQRTDLTDAEKGDAVYALLEYFPDEYSTLKDIADAIGKPIGTVRAWTRKSLKLAESVRSLIAADQLTEKSASYLLKYDHDTQFKLANIAVNYPLNERQAIKFFKLYEANQDADLTKLAEEAKGIKRVEVELGKLSKKARKEVEAYLKERERKAIEARKIAIEKAKEAPRIVRPKVVRRVPTEVVLEKAEILKEKLEEVEPTEREELTRSVEERLDYLTRRVELEREIAEDKEMQRLLEKWRVNVVHKVTEETPERFVMNFEESLHGIWSRIGVEYPSSVKDLGRRELVKALSIEQLERLEKTLKTTTEELEEFRAIINSELFGRRMKTK